VHNNSEVVHAQETSKGNSQASVVNSALIDFKSHDSGRQTTFSSKTLVNFEEEIYRSNQRRSFKQHQAKELPDVTTGETVWIRDQNRLGKIQGYTKHPRSFLVETEKGTVRRNRSALVKAELQSPDNPATFTSTASYHAGQGHMVPGTITEAPMQTVRSQTTPLQTRSGRVVRPPDQLDL